MRKKILIMLSIFINVLWIISSSYAVKTQTARIMLEESYIDEKGNNKLEGINVWEVEYIAGRFLYYSGFDVIPKDSLSSDVTLKIKASGVALYAYYSDGKAHYTGARVSGNILLETSDKSVYSKSFDGYKKPSEFVFKGSSHPPNDAPFGTAFTLPNSFSQKMAEMIGELYVSALFTALKVQSDSLVYSAALLAIESLNITSVNFKGKSSIAWGAIKHEQTR